jgi:hypothetical protein
LRNEDGASTTPAELGNDAKVGGDGADGLTNTKVVRWRVRGFFVGCCKGTHEGIIIVGGDGEGLNEDIITVVLITGKGGEAGWWIKGGVPHKGWQ